MSDPRDRPEFPKPPKGGDADEAIRFFVDERVLPPGFKIDTRDDPGESRVILGWRVTAGEIGTPYSPETAYCQTTEVRHGPDFEARVSMRRWHLAWAAAGSVWAARESHGLSPRLPIAEGR
jgi:hypothetical protein